MNKAIDFLTLLTKKHISDFCQVRLFFCYKQTDEVRDNKSLALPVEKITISPKRKKKSKLADAVLLE